jgi:hypothetical protein
MWRQVSVLHSCKCAGPSIVGAKAAKPTVSLESAFDSVGAKRRTSILSIYMFEALKNSSNKKPLNTSIEVQFSIGDVNGIPRANLEKHRRERGLRSPQARISQVQFLQRGESVSVSASAFHLACAFQSVCGRSWCRAPHFPAFGSSCT